MKSTWLLILLCMCLVGAFTSPGWATTDESDSVVMWHMDSAFGFVGFCFVYDDNSLSPRGGNLVEFGNIANAKDANCWPTINTAGYNGTNTALGFDGVNDQAFSQNAIWIANGYPAVAVDAWFNAGRATGTQTLVSVLNCWNVQLSGSDVIFNVYTTGTTRTYTVTNAVVTGTWQHVVAKCDVAGHVKLQVDALPAVEGDGLPLKLLAAADRITLANTLNSTTQFFMGYIDEVKVTSPSMRSPFTDNRTTKALWHMDAYDVAGLLMPDDDIMKQARNADLPLYSTLNSNSKWTVPNQGGVWLVDPTVAGSGNPSDPAIGYPARNSAFGKCMYFNGAGHAVIPAANLAWDPNNYQIDFWMKFPMNYVMPAGVNTYYTLFCRGGCVLYRILSWKAGTNDELHVECIVYDRAAGSKTVSFIFYRSGTTYLDIKQWNHLKLTVNGKVVTLYVNDVSRSTQTLATYGATASPANGNMIGMWDNGNPGISPYIGYFDEFKISKVFTTSADDPKCGDVGYNAMDINKDCVVDFKDILGVTQDWLMSNPLPATNGADNFPNMVEQKWSLGQNFSIPQATITPTIDGVFNASEWADARTIEMIYPAMATAPNLGQAYVDSTTSVPLDPMDFSQYWYLKWDSSYLYVALVCDDNDIDIADVTRDAPQFGFNYNNNPSNAFLTQAYLWDMQTGNTWKTNSVSVPAPANSPFVRVNNPAGYYVIEAKLAWSDICYGNPSYVPTVGDKHGFVLCSQDHDMTGIRRHWLLSAGYSNLGTPATWQTIKLVNTMDCHEMPQSKYDLNNDCNVNFTEFNQIAANWMSCTDVTGVKCKM